MPRRKFIDKKAATTFTLVHRAQNDPLIHDENAPSMVLTEKAQQRPRRPVEDDYAYSSAGSVVSFDSRQGNRSGKRPAKQLGDLEDEFGLAVRRNEGEAAQHGVFFDDTEYDYMQHMRDLGTGEGGVVWVDATAPPQRQKGRQRLEDALREADLNDGVSARGDDTRSVGTASTSASTASTLFPQDMFASEFVKKQTYQDQQNIPDDIAGLQPDMDPALREVLEALDDDAYAEDEDEDFFAELTRDGLEVEKDEWEDNAYQRELLDEDEDARSESEDTVRASSPPPPILDMTEGAIAEPPTDTQAVPPADPTNGAWLDEFKKFKSKTQSSAHQLAAPEVRETPSAVDSTALSSVHTGRTESRKPAKPPATNYSMTSSVRARTEQQRLLDARFEKLQASYEAEEYPDDIDGDDALSAVSGVTGLSKASNLSKYSNASNLSKASRFSSYSHASDASVPQLQRTDFNSIIDDFLNTHSTVGKRGRRVRRLPPQSGMEQLDELRKELGPAKVKQKDAVQLAK